MWFTKVHGKNYSAFKIPYGVDSREVAEAKDERTTKQTSVSLFKMEMICILVKIGQFSSKLEGI